MYSKSLLSTTLLTIGASAQSLTSVLSNNDLTSSLAALLEQYPNIASQLEGASNVTLFAPFNRAINEAVQAGMVPTEESAIAALLDYHVVSGVIPSSDITRDRVFTPTMLTNSTYTNVTGGQVVEIYQPEQIPVIISGLQRWSTVVSGDHEFDGGIIHIVDRILTIPPNITATAVAENLTALAGALIATDLVTTLESASDITIFAPANTAFEGIGSALGNLTTNQLANILQYHVVQGTVAYSSTLQSGSVETLNGDNVEITVEDGVVFVNSARVTNPDVLIAGGVIHIIDSVLNPDNSTASPSSVVDVWPGASSAPLGSLTAGLPEASMSVGPGAQTTAGGVGMTTAAGGSASSSSSGVAAMPTGAIGVAALFGGAALAANW